MDLNSQNLKKLANFNKIFLIDCIDQLNIDLNDDIAVVFIQKKNELELNEIQKKHRDKFFYFTFREIGKKWSFYDLIRRRSFHKFNANYNLFKEDDNLIIKFFKKIYRSDLYELSYKKFILNNFVDYQIIIDITRILKRYNKNVCILINNHSYCFINNRLKKKKKFNYTKKNIKKFLQFTIFPLYLIIKNKICFKYNKKFYDNFYRLYKNGYFVGKLGHADWLWDKKKKNLFVIEGNLEKDSKQLKSLKENLYPFIFCNNKTAIGSVSLISIINLILIYFPMSIIVGLYCYFLKNDNFSFFYDSWLNFFKWNLFVKNYYSKNYVSYHDYEPNHILRNIILNQNSFNTVHYKHTNSENVYNYANQKSYINPNLLWMYYDYEFHQSIQSIEMSKDNRSLSKKHLICGPTFYHNEAGNIKDKNYDVIFFSSTFRSFSPVNLPNSHLNFLNLAIEISKDSNLKILFKSKNPIKKYEEYNEIFRSTILQMKNVKNIDIIDTTTDVFKLIKNSKFSIIMPFSATWIFSLTLKKKFFFVDSLENYKNSYFSKFDNLIVNNNTDAINLYKSMTVRNLNDDKTYNRLYKDTLGTDENLIKKNPLYTFLNNLKY